VNDSMDHGIHSSQSHTSVFVYMPSLASLYAKNVRTVGLQL